MPARATRVLRVRRRSLTAAAGPLLWRCVPSSHLQIVGIRLHVGVSVVEVGHARGHLGTRAHLFELHPTRFLGVDLLIQTLYNPVASLAMSGLQGISCRHAVSVCLLVFLRKARIICILRGKSLQFSIQPGPLALPSEETVVRFPRGLPHTTRLRAGRAAYWYMGKAWRGPYRSTNSRISLHERLPPPSTMAAASRKP